MNLLQINLNQGAYRESNDNYPQFCYFEYLTNISYMIRLLRIKKNKLMENNKITKRVYIPFGQKDQLEKIKKVNPGVKICRHRTRVKFSGCKQKIIGMFTVLGWWVTY